MTDRIQLDDLTSDDLDALYRRLDSLEKHLAMEENASRQLLQQRQEMAGERFIWQERGDRAEISARANKTAAVEALECAEQAEVQRAALKRAHVALASQAGRDQAALNQVRALAETWRGTTVPLGTSINRWWDARLVELNTALEPPAEPEQPPAPTPLPEYIDISEHRHDHGHRAWAWRCWGDGDCDGWLSLDHSSEDSARRAAGRHLTDSHSTAPASA